MSIKPIECKLKMLRNGQEQNDHETATISVDVLLFNQVFGGLPLTYVKHPNNKTTLEFSKTLQMFGFAYIACLTGVSCGGLYYDYGRYLAGKPLIMSDTMSTITLFADIGVLNLMTMMVTVTAGRKYYKLMAMCKLLQKVDASLQQKPDILTSRFEVFVTFALTTAVLVWTLASHIYETSYNIMIYSHKICMFYTQIAMYLLFTFVTRSLTMRFRHINETIRQEVVRLNLRPLIKDLGLSNIISGTVIA